MVEPYPTDHLREKLVSRDITWAEIVETVEHPEVSFGPDERGCMVHQKNALSVVVARDGAVITALLRTDVKWTDEDARGRNR